MDQLVSRLSNLSYEIFGVFVPGAVAMLLLIAWWGALGDLAPVLSNHAVPVLTFDATQSWINSLNAALGVGFGLPTIVASYFLGHFILWSSRAGLGASQAKGLMRWWMTMTFRIHRPAESYNPKLEPLLIKVLERFSVGDLKAFDWRQAYPIIKCYLMENRRFSLLPTYQNKYTLHRSIAFAAVSVAWLSILGLLAGLIVSLTLCAGVDLRPLMLLLLFSGLVASAFSSSYRYYWEMWGNTVITESFSHLFGPQDDASAKPD